MTAYSPRPTRKPHSEVLSHKSIESWAVDKRLGLQKIHVSDKLNFDRMQGHLQNFIILSTWSLTRPILEEFIDTDPAVSVAPRHLPIL